MITILRAARSAARAHQSRSPLLPCLTAALLGAGCLIGWFLIEDHPAQATAASFSICKKTPYENCVVDGDTFYLGRDPIRIADIDAPETHPARCPYEAELGAMATKRLREILNARPFEVQIYERDTDKYGRKLRIIAQNGYSVGGMMVMEGLARSWTGHRRPWCNEQAI
jgi:endonuclease YncB( thermonuclease family)